MRACAPFLPPRRPCLGKFFRTINNAKDQQSKLAEKCGVDLRRKRDLPANDTMLAFASHVPRCDPCIETPFPVGLLVVRSHDNNRVLIDQGSLKQRVETIGIDVLQDRWLNSWRSQWRVGMTVLQYVD